MKHLLECPKTDLVGWLREKGQPKFHAQQLHDWIFARRAQSIDDCTSLSLKLRGQLADDFQIWTTEVVKHSIADDGTEKLLLRLDDGGVIECVLIRYGDRRTVCISTQVGCAMGCVFCASGLDGVDRNLRPGEIVEQMLRLQSLLPDDERLSHIVVMGMGEPLANLPNLLTALEAATDESAFGISARRITISTVGLAPAIRKLAKLDLRYHLAVSLHAPNDELRNEIVPVNRKTSIEEILSAADHYFEVTGRRVTYEYVLLADLNDSVAHARQLGKLLKDRNALLNVIPYNPVEGLPFQTPSDHSTQRFREILESYKISVRFRRRKGDKINAACGQLRRSNQPALFNLDS